MNAALTPAKAKELLDQHLNDPEIMSIWMSSGHPLHKIAVNAVNGMRFFASNAPRSGPAYREAAKGIMPLSPILSDALGVNIDWSDQFDQTEIAEAAIAHLDIRAAVDPEYQAAINDKNHPDHAALIAERQECFDERFPPSPEQAARKAQPSIDAAQAAVDAAKAEYDSDPTDAAKLEAWANAMTALAKVQDAAKAVPTTSQEAKPQPIDPKEAIKAFEESDRWKAIVANPDAQGRAEAVAERAALYDAAFPSQEAEPLTITGRLS